MSKNEMSEMLCSYWLTYSAFLCSRQKSSYSENQLSLNEMKQVQGEFVDYNVLLSVLLSKTCTCDMALIY